MPVSTSLQRPETVDEGRLFSSNVSVFIVFHALALTAFIPYLFSWTGVALVFLGFYVFGGLGINIGYHRLLTHRSFRCPKWLERTFTVLGVCCLQDSPSRWVAVHRLHHQHSDTRPDPHTPLVSLLWSHLGWMVLKNRNLRARKTLGKYARDVLKDPFYLWMHRHKRWQYIYAAHAFLFYAAGLLAGWMMTGTGAGALQFGLSVFVWGVIVRTIYVWHVTWTANSLTHLFGYRNYETSENSRNNWFVAILTLGEGWHNNHHAYQQSARHGHRWWELDPIYYTILLLRAVGLVTDLRHPNVTERLKPEADGSGGPHVSRFGSDGSSGPSKPQHAAAA